MRTKTILLVFAAMTIAMAACNGSSDDKVVKAFKEYVKTDFGNPEYFIEITQIGTKDTISSENMKEYLSNLDTISWALSKRQLAEAELLKRKLDEDSIFFVQHEVKARIMTGKDSKEVRSYYVIEMNGKFTVQDHAMTNDEAPEIFYDVLKLVNDVTIRLKRINEELYEYDF